MGTDMSMFSPFPPAFPPIGFEGSRTEATASACVVFLINSQLAIRLVCSRSKSRRARDRREVPGESSSPGGSITIAEDVALEEFIAEEEALAAAFALTVAAATSDGDMAKYSFVPRFNAAAAMT